MTVILFSSFVDLTVICNKGHTLVSASLSPMPGVYKYIICSFRPDAPSA